MPTNSPVAAIKWFLAAWPLLLSPAMVSKGFSTGLLGMMGDSKARSNTKVGGPDESFPMQRRDQADIELPAKNEISVTIPVQAIPLAQQHDVVQVKRDNASHLLNERRIRFWVHGPSAAPLPNRRAGKPCT